MSEVLVRFEGAQEIIIERLTQLGVFKTRSEAIRAGILELGKEYNVFKSLNDLEDELASRKMSKISEEIAKGKRKVFTEAHARKKHGLE